ncbi:MAG TPA: molybdate ABC transporter substrate-binding protein, partial [Candidatus Acidoferrales bacterium]|nr:molybdate ABC transporter substrate-binding protein [Candidatus Acidoferrales bacterium]
MSLAAEKVRQRLMRAIHMPRLLFTIAGVFAALELHAAQVTVFAAASLTDSLKEIAADYEKNADDKIVFNFAASGVLARQIQAGAPADIFFSADETQMDRLAGTGALAPETRRDLLGNSLVIVTPPENAIVHSPADLTNAAVTHVALGDAKTVPAGSYAKAYLETARIWEGLQSKMVPCENVRAVLAVVA